MSVTRLESHPDMPGFLLVDVFALLRHQGGDESGPVCSPCSHHTLSDGCALDKEHPVRQACMGKVYVPEREAIPILVAEMLERGE